VLYLVVHLNESTEGASIYGICQNCSTTRAEKGYLCKS